MRYVPPATVRPVNLIETRKVYMYQVLDGEVSDAVLVSRDLVRDPRYRLVDSFPAAVYLHGGRTPHWEIRRLDNYHFPSSFVTRLWGELSAEVAKSA